MGMEQMTCKGREEMKEGKEGRKSKKEANLGRA
jgi:hypothetical protein